MMNTFNLTISSPDGEIFSDNILKIVLRGAGGDLAIMAGHIPFITTVQKGICKITLSDSEEKSAEIESGLLTVSNEKTTLLTGNLKWI